MVFFILLAFVASVTTSGTYKHKLKKTEIPVAVVFGKIVGNESFFTDKRDGHTYRQINIGKQTWMAENLNYGKLVLNMQQANNGIPEKSFYKNDTLVGNKMGALYTWEEAVQYKNKEGLTQGLCPDGWHIPGNEEWALLCNNLDKSITKTIDGWQGENIGIILIDESQQKFNVKLGGNAVSHWNFYFNEMAYFWTSTSNSNASAKYWALSKHSKQIYNGSGDNQIGMNIRCVKDE